MIYDSALSRGHALSTDFALSAESLSLLDLVSNLHRLRRKEKTNTWMETNWTILLQDFKNEGQIQARGILLFNLLFAIVFFVTVVDLYQVLRGGVAARF